MKTPRPWPGRFRVSCCWYGSIKPTDATCQMRGSGFLISMILMAGFGASVAASDFTVSPLPDSPFASADLAASDFASGAALGCAVCAATADVCVLSGADATSLAGRAGRGRGNGVFGGVTAALRVSGVAGEVFGAPIRGASRDGNDPVSFQSSASSSSGRSSK